MAGNSVATIGSGKPKATGGILVAPTGSVLPVDTAATFAAAFVKLGYVGEDGVQPGGERSNEEKRDWAGDVIANLQSGHSSKFSFTLLAVYDPDVLRQVFGPNNVTVTPATSTAGTKIVVTEDGSDLPFNSWGFDMVTGAKKQRLVVPNGQLTAVEELPFVASDLQGFTVTLDCYKDAAGIKVYRYYDDGKFTTV
ncbi:phage tail tube protein [Rhodococcoides fascians]|uniref:phage tail tube protein n=1 Tax=Rhodococcoides fascians TaxID=1828 RepID=UPI00055FCFE4|nr:hypothetical protein [Rhodococcus fascians]